MADLNISVRSHEDNIQKRPDAVKRYRGAD